MKNTNISISHITYRKNKYKYVGNYFMTINKVSKNNTYKIINLTR